jgi:hypothetical protein
MKSDIITTDRNQQSQLGKKVSVMKIIKKNVGNTDTILRVIVGMIILFAGLYYNSLWGFVGIIFIGSGTLSFCPVYRLFKIQTCSPNLEREN